MAPQRTFPTPPHRWHGAIGVLLLLMAAWCSTGHHSEDEHHQTLGLALTRAGAPTAEAVWEHGERIRGSALPWIATGMLGATGAIGLTDPFTRTALLRLLTALLACVVVHRALRATMHRLPTGLHGPYRLLASGLWFLPFLYVRFASETWAGLWLLAGIAPLVAPIARPRATVWAGACFALAVWVRPPVAAAAAGIVAWWWYTRRPTGKHIALFVVAAMGMLALSVIADSIFYGTPTCSILRYTVMGFTGHPDHDFGRLPWWYYFPWIVKYAVPPVGLCILLAFAMLLRKDRGHPLVWAMVPFMLLHIALPHKELRFLYPLAPLVPWLLVEGWRHVPRLHRRAIARPLLGVLIACNVPALAVAVLTPAGNGRTALAGHLHHTGHARAPVAAIAPDHGWRLTVPRFYRPHAPAPVIVSRTPPADVHFAVIAAKAPGRPPGFVAVMPGQPPWATSLLELYHWTEWRGPAVLLRRAHGASAVHEEALHGAALGGGGTGTGR
ncbi:MAG: hypothetical protein RBT71_11220 [Flavobacteriales bacterium]|jgi:phosphatidylinositol glycan class B|nr:hypothetical protein [Flavobacteriales bacterium]